MKSILRTADGIRRKDMDETKYSEQWAEIGQSVINEFADDKFKPIIEFGISIGYVVSEEAPERNGIKTMAECIAVRKDHQRQFNPHDYLVKIYAPNVAYMNDIQKRILMEHELMHIRVYENSNGETKLGTNPHDVQDFRDIIEKYGMDWAEDLHQQITWEDLQEDDEEAVPELEGSMLLLPGRESA